MTDQTISHSSSPTSLAEALENLLPDLRGFAWSLCQNRSLADDLVQDACMKAWTAADSLKPGSSIKPWVFQILRNEWRQHQRRAWRTQLVDSDEIERSLVSESNAETLADSIKATNAIYSLPEQHRDAIILILAVGMTYSEAAEVLGCSVGTIKSRLNRARQSLLTDLSHGRRAKTTTPDATTHSHGGLERLIEQANRLITKSTRLAA